MGIAKPKKACQLTYVEQEPWYSFIVLKKAFNTGDRGEWGLDMLEKLGVRPLILHLIWTFLDEVELVCHASENSSKSFKA